MDKLLSFFSLTFKKNLNRSPMSIWLDHDGFKRGSITSAWLRKHLHCLPHICHVWFSCLPAVYRSILITAVKPEITNKGNGRFDKADIYDKYGNMKLNNKWWVGLFIFYASDISWFKFQYCGSCSDNRLILFCCFVKVFFFNLEPFHVLFCVGGLSSHHYSVYV